MTLPDPVPGLVVGYDFLFREQAESGMENASKPHPAAIVLVVENEGRTRTGLVAISHSAPSRENAAFYMKLRPDECREIGLDAGDHWINLRDINLFDWPGFDLMRSAPGRSFVYGRMKRSTFVRLVEAMKTCAGRTAISRD